MSSGIGPRRRAGTAGGWKLILLVGIPASGTTASFVARVLATHVRLSPDVVRTRARDQRLLEACPGVGQRAVTDDTDRTRADRGSCIEPARAARLRVVGYHVATTPADRSPATRRRGGRARVPVPGCSAPMRGSEAPRLDEGLDELHTVRCPPA